MSQSVLILPGWHGSGPEHWQRWLVGEVPNARVVEQQDWAHPDRDAWLAALDAAIAETPGEIVLVGHSLGTILIPHHAARGDSSRIVGALLIAPGDADLNAATEPDLVTFAPVPRTKLPYPSILVGSRTDPHMAFDRTRQLAADLGSEFIDVGDAGHVNVASGYGPFPLALDLLARLAPRKS